MLSSIDNKDKKKSFQKNTGIQVKSNNKLIVDNSKQSTPRHNPVNLSDDFHLKQIGLYFQQSFEYSSNDSSSSNNNQIDKNTNFLCNSGGHRDNIITPVQAFDNVLHLFKVNDESISNNTIPV